MAYKCRICGANYVDHDGDVCELCAIGQDPYASAMGGSQTNQPDVQNYGFNSGGASQDQYIPSSKKSRKVLLGGGASLSNTDPYGNDITPRTADSGNVAVYQAGQLPDAAQVQSPPPKAPVSKPKTRTPITSGITKNISVDTQKRSMLAKIFRSVVSGIPLTLDDEATMFQVFPDFSGTSLNAMGNACDQVIVYGKLNAGTVSENNDVEVFGYRDSNNNVIAKTIRNKASGTLITPTGVISAAVIRVIFIFALLLIIAMCAALGVQGIIWAVVIVICLTNLPLVFKILGVAFGAIFSIFRKL